MTPTEFRKFKDENKLSITDLAELLMQSEASVYAKLKGTRFLNKRDRHMIEGYKATLKQPANA